MKGIWLTLLLLLTPLAHAEIETLRFQSAAQEQQYRILTAALRCPKCQNNSIADSNAMIAADMRHKVWQLLQQGQTPAQITDYMVARYGHFVTYDPPLTAGTLLLWLGPLLCVVLGGAVIVRRGRRRADTVVLDAAAAQRLRQLLDEEKRTPQ